MRHFIGEPMWYLPLRRFPRASLVFPMTFKHFSVLILAGACALAQNTIYNPNPSRAFGQPRLTNLSSGNPNLVEGREFFLPQSIAIDTSANPPRIYVADTVNNRVLGWKNASAVSKGDFADIVIGQLDLSSTRVGGPSTSQTTGLTAPTAVGVDASGNVYVADTGNNRILRFPQPFNQTGQTPQPDLVIGQRTFSSDNRPNQGNAVPSEKTIALSSGGASRTSIVFDAQGNLWFADAGNNRVLRYPVSQLAPFTIEPAANLVLGQPDFKTGTFTNPPNTVARVNKSILVGPSGIAFGSNGDVYVSDGYGRVLYFKGPVTTNGQTATRLIGVPTPTTTDPNPRAFGGCPATSPQPCETTLGAVTATGSFIPPEGIAVFNNQLYVADNGNNRVVKFDSPANWPTECVYTGQQPCAAGTLISPAGIGFIGQVGGTDAVKANRGGLPNSNTLNGPVALAFDQQGNMWVADSQNHRVLAFPASGGTYNAANRVLGQLDFTYNAPNLVEGKELFLYDPVRNAGAAGVTVDPTSDPPHLYIADSFNNRILGFRDARNVRPGSTADLVIGQPDLLTTTPNTSTGTADQPNDKTLISPIGLAVDKVGDLWVADSGNRRVLRIPRPFDQTGTIAANLVLGQSSFFTKISDARRNQMNTPWGLAFSSDGSLAVSDAAHNRVLIFKKPAGGDFTSGMDASQVIGQPDYLTTTTGTASNRFNSPRGIAIDANDRLYVTDSGNNRVSIFRAVTSGEIDPSAVFMPNIGAPQAIAVSPRTGESWVTDIQSGRLVRFPIYEQWFLTNQSISEIRTVGTPLAIGIDGSDNPVIAESINRVSMYYPLAAFSNAASYVTRGLTPGGLSYLARNAPSFAPGVTVSAPSLPLPTTLSDYQVNLNGRAVPIFQVLPDRVTFQTPWDVPSTGNADVELVRASTGEVLASATFTLQAADPGFFTANATGNGPLAAVNQDGTVNTPNNAAPRGSVVLLFGTGIGPLDNPPPNGAAASGPVSAPGKPIVSMNPGGNLSDADILYFGLVNWFPGVFQLNIRIPMAVPPSNSVLVGMFWRDVPSTVGPNGTRLTTTIAVK